MGALKHTNVVLGRITEVEYEAEDEHILVGQAKGDMVIATSAAQLGGLAIGPGDTILSSQGGLPTWRSPANILTDLSGQAGAAFDWNGQNLTNPGTVDGVDIAAHAVDLDAHTYSFMQKIRTGVHFWPFIVRAEGTLNLTVDALYAIPFFVARDITIDRLGIEVTGADVGKIVRLGIYNDGTNLYPGTLLQDYGTVSGAGVAVVVASSDQVLTKGLYWLALVSDGGPQLKMYTSAYPILGSFPTNFAIVSESTGWRKTSVGAGVLPNPFTAGGTLISGVPIVLPRLKTLD